MKKREKNKLSLHTLPAPICIRKMRMGKWRCSEWMLRIKNAETHSALCATYPKLYAEHTDEINAFFQNLAATFLKVHYEQILTCNSALFGRLSLSLHALNEDLFLGVTRTVGTQEKQRTKGPDFYRIAPDTMRFISKEHLTKKQKESIL